MKNVVDRNIAMRILRITRRLRRFAKPLRFRTKIACIKNNVLLFFLFLAWPMFHFPNRRYVLRTRDSFLFLHPEIFWLHERGARINFLPSVIFLILSFVKVSPDKWITRMACFAKSLVRAKAKSDDLSLSPKATSIFFVYFLHLHWVSFSLFLSFLHTFSFSLRFTRARARARTSVPILDFSKNSVSFLLR